MTIHKAKGLQAPVVILTGMGKPKTANKTDIRAFHRDQQLWLATGDTDPDDAERIAAESDGEARRLLYVALTRAEDLLFIAARQNAAYPPLQQLREHNAVTPESPDTLLAPDPAPVRWAHTPATPAAAPLAALPDPKRRGWRKTSFTALAARIPDDSHNLAVHDRLDLELQHETQTDDSADTAYPYTFPRGPQAGSYLHETLEKIRWHRRAHWPQLLATLADRHHLPELHHHLDDLQHWFTAILTSPLASGATLARLEHGERELGFTLALNAERPLPLAAIRDHFAAWGKTLPLADHPALYKYLRGEIDLVYQHEGRYHLLDYKSNHLGDRAHHYDTAAMTRAMDEHHYWLQAALYQTALHRLLRERLPDYRPADHLGSVEYYFIRAAAPDSRHGHLRIDIPTDWLLRLDQLLT